MVELKTGITLKFPSNNLSKRLIGQNTNWFPNGSSLSSLISGNVGVSTYGIKPDNAPSENIAGGFGYGTLFVVGGRGDEGYGYGYAIYSGSNAAGSRVFATYDNKDSGWSERVSKSDLSAKTPTCQEQYMIADTQTLSSDSATTLWDSEITIPFDCIMIGNWKVLCKSSDANASFYYMVNNAYVQGRAQWDGTVQTDNAINIFVMNKFTKGTKLSVSVQGNCSIRGNNTSLTRYTFTFIQV